MAGTDCIVNSCYRRIKPEQLSMLDLSVLRLRIAMKCEGALLMPFFLERSGCQPDLRLPSPDRVCKAAIDKMVLMAGTSCSSIFRYVSLLRR